MTFSRRIVGAVLALLLGLAAALPAGAGAAPGVFAVYVNGRPLYGEVAAMVGNQATVQVQAVFFSGLGHDMLHWNGNDRTLTIHGLPRSPIVLQAGNPEVIVAGTPVRVPVAPYIQGAYFMAPLEFYRVALGARVEWAPAARSVEITTAPWYSTAGFGPDGTAPRPFTGLVRAGDGTMVLAAGQTWRSTDAGATWAPAGTGLPAYSGARFWADAGAPRTVYAALDDRPGLWVSHDAGLTWAPVPGLGGSLVLAVAAGGPDRLAVSVTPYGRLGPLGAGVYHWDAGTGTWLGDGPGARANGLALDRQGRLWAATEAGLAWQAPGAPAWIRPQAGPTAGRATQVLPHPTDPQWLWALVDGTVIASQDGGATWQAADLGLAPVAAAACHQGCRLAAGPGPEVLLLAGDWGVWYSPTGGGEWFRLTGYWPAARVLDLAADGERLLLATTHGGVIMPPRPAHDQEWRDLRPAARLPRLAPIPVRWGPGLLPGAGQVGGLALDPTAPDTAYAVVLAEAGGAPPSILRTGNGGRDWAPVAPLPEGEGGAPWPWRLWHHPARSGFLVALAGVGEDRVPQAYLTIDGGATWAPLAGLGGWRTGLSHLLILASGRILTAWESRAGTSVLVTDDYQAWQRAEGAPGWHTTGLVANPAAPGTVYACDWNGCAASADGGSTWAARPHPPEAVGPPFWLVWGEGAPGQVFSGRHVSADGLQTWAPVPGLTAADSPRVVAVSPANPQHLAALAQTARGTHLWRTADGGATWVSLGAPPAGDGVGTAAFDRSGRLWVSNRAGLWRLPAP